MGTKQLKKESGVALLPDSIIVLPNHTRVVHDNGFNYVLNITIGTPPQQVSLNLDTGSSFTFVDPVCQHNSSFDCTQFSICNVKASTSAKSLGVLEQILYQDGSEWLDVDMYSETFHFGDSEITAQQFGLVTAINSFSNDDPGMGLISLRPSNSSNPASILDTLVAQNIINSRAFSLDLRASSFSKGAIIFGGIDATKYNGSLEKVPMTAAPLPLNQYIDGSVCLSSYLTQGAASKTYTSSMQKVLLNVFPLSRNLNNTQHALNDHLVYNHNNGLHNHFLLLRVVTSCFCPEAASSRPVPVLTTTPPSLTTETLTTTSLYTVTACNRVTSYTAGSVKTNVLTLTTMIAVVMGTNGPGCGGIGGGKVTGDSDGTVTTPFTGDAAQVRRTLGYVSVGVVLGVWAAFYLC
ncbi:acid protease [Stipitochalara longipes BDJ]|nr:acid protease [Stipitochalara longipes BDJ]